MILQWNASGILKVSNIYLERFNDLNIQEKMKNFDDEEYIDVDCTLCNGNCDERSLCGDERDNNDDLML